jgi:outer membrane lipoprotein-sorting protein
MKMRRGIPLLVSVKRTWTLYLWTIFFTSLSSTTAGIQTQAQMKSELRQAYKKMDEAAKGFRTFSARFTQKTYTAILDEFDSPQTGEYFYSFDKDGSVLWRHETTNPAPKILTVRKGIATVYKPKIKEAMIYNLGKRREYVDYLAVGIGKPSGELREKFNISFQGSELIAGAPCFVLICKPKGKEVTSQVSSITIWLKKSSGTPAQFKIEAPNADYLLETFSDEKLNAEIPDSKFEQKLPAGINILRIQ